jgi:hypothetical protein
MTTHYDWMTNDPKAAKDFRKIDGQYARDREAAKNLPLSTKIEALRNAKLRQIAARRAVIEALQSTGK